MMPSYQIKYKAKLSNPVLIKHWSQSNMLSRIKDTFITHNLYDKLYFIYLFVLLIYEIILELMKSL